jgi:glyoxylase-like metal-dependent hydrolase (beta-lactamase superfamily II)
MRRASGWILAAALVVVAASYLTWRTSAQSKPAQAKSTQSAAGFADRLYILNGGYGHAADAGQWENMMVPPNTPIDIGAPAHLIKHGDTWMFFDTSTNDNAAKLPEGYGTGIRWIKTEAQTLPPQLKAIGITPDDIRYVGISHNHADHTGNVWQFKKAEVLIQRREYDFMYRNSSNGPTGPPNFSGPVMSKDHPHKLLDGDYDVFGDGSVILFFTAGHTLGTQVCLVHLKNTGYVLLSGDAVHLRSNFDTRRIPRVAGANDENQWLWSVPIAFERVAALMAFYKAHLWVHHDIEDYKGRKYAPQYYD